MTTSRPPAVDLHSTIEEIGDYWEWDALARANGWTDGLPVAPPTVERVVAIIEYLGREPEAVLGNVPPAGGVLTIEQLAIQCAMAGCLPEHVPVVIAAMEAMLDPAFNLYGVQCTTNPCAPLVIVSGPIVDELGFNAADGSFGGGSHANAAVGRATRLILWNLGKGRPGVNDMTPLGQPAKFGFCVAERTDSPWRPIHTDLGLPDEQSSVVVFACQSPEPIVAPGTPERILNVLRTTLPTTGINMFHAAGQYLVSMNPRVAYAFARGGHGKDEIRQWLFDNARYDLGHVRREGVLVPGESTQYYWGEVKDAPDLTTLDDAAQLPMVETVNDIHVLVTGGWGQFWLGFSAGWGNYGGYAQARPVRRLAGARG